MTDASNIRRLLTLMEGPADEYRGPKASDTISYSAEETGGEITKVIATLSSHDSGRYTKLGRNLQRIETLEKEIKVLKEETKADTRELVADLFNAEDAAATRVVDTVSFLFEMTKDPKATETYKYAKILDELQKHLTPELINVLETLKTKHKSTTQKAAALSTTDKARTSESLTEGVFDQLKGFFKKLYQEIKAWGVKYDSQLDALKAEAANMSESIDESDDNLYAQATAITKQMDHLNTRSPEWQELARKMNDINAKIAKANGYKDSDVSRHVVDEADGSKFHKIGYSEFERMADSSEDFNETEIDGKRVIYATNNGKVNAIYYPAKQFGTASDSWADNIPAEYAGDVVSYAEADPYWPWP